MTSTIIGKGNITLYSKDMIELSGDKYNEIYKFNFIILNTYHLHIN